MLKVVDTSYYIINNKEKKEFFIYYDINHKIDCNMSLWDIMFDLNIENVNEDNKDFLLQEFFKKNWTRFFMIKSIPYDTMVNVLPWDSILNMVNQIAQTIVKYEDLKAIPSNNKQFLK